MSITVNRRKRPLAEIDGNTVRTYQHGYSADMPKLKKQRRTHASSRGSLQTQSLPERASNHTTPTPTPESDIPDTHLTVTRDDISAAAGGLPSRPRAESNSSDTDSDYNYLAGPSSKRRKKDNAEWRRRHNYKPKKAKNKKPKPQAGTHYKTDVTPKSPLLGKTNIENPKPTRSVIAIPDSDDSSTSIKSLAKQTSPEAPSTTTQSATTQLINGRRFTTLHPPRHAKTRQLHLFPDYHAPHEPFPADFTLTELSVLSKSCNLGQFDTFHAAWMGRSKDYSLDA